MLHKCAIKGNLGISTLGALPNTFKIPVNGYNFFLFFYLDGALHKGKFMLNCYQNEIELRIRKKVNIA